jgi:peptide/nickel transport system substrate-binding protein
MGAWEDENVKHNDLLRGAPGSLSRRQFLKVAGITAAGLTLSGGIAGALASCGSDETAAAGAGTSTSGAAGAAAGAPKYGGTLRVVSGQVPANIGWPPEIVAEGSGLQYCLESLLRGDEKGGLHPWLAESYDVADDLKSITFHIRKGVKFHDGSDLNAEAVKWNLEQYMTATVGGESVAPTTGAATATSAAAAAGGAAPDAAGGAPMGGGHPWSSIDVVDDYTVRLNITEWENTILYEFADNSPMIFMVSKLAYDTNGKDWMRQHPVGTGPFKLSNYEQDVSFDMVKNEAYWAKDDDGSQLPYLDGVNLIGVADVTTMKMMAESKEADLFQNAAPGQNAYDYAQMGLEISFVMDSNAVLVPDSAHADSPWSDQKVREAAEYALDRDTIAKTFGYGYWEAPYQLPPRGSTIYDANFSLARKYDLEKAKQLLTEAGKGGGFKTKILVNPLMSRDVAVAIQAQWAKVGIEAELEFETFASSSQIEGPNGTWRNGCVLMPVPIQGPPSFIGGLQFATYMWGSNWQKSDELAKAIEAAMGGEVPDGALVKVATDMMSKDAICIPVHENGVGEAVQPGVEITFGTRGLLPFWDTEEMWISA